jgi:folate-binding protein YgfZ
MDEGYQALREGAAWLDLSSRGRIRITGEDRARLLHAMVTNHVQQLQPSRGCYAFFLDAQGRILGDMTLLAFADSFLLDTEPETRQSSYEHLDKYIIADDVTLEDVTARTAELGLEGPRSAEVLGVMGAPIPEAPWSHASRGEIVIARRSTTGDDGFALICPRDERQELERELESAGAIQASSAAVRVVRLERGRPRYGEDISSERLPQETQLLEAMHFNKGCYLGQEIVERIRSRGGVHRFLVRLAIDAQEAPAAGAKITTGGEEIGEITSAAWSPAEGRVVALGYVKLGEAPSGAPLEAAGARVEIIAPKPGP